MSKFPKIYRNDADRDYKYAEVQVLKDTYASIGVDIRDGELAVWSQGKRVLGEKIPAKKVRKFARALLALADEVDPPASKTEYFRADDELFYRIVGDGEPELWSSSKGHWTTTVLAAHTAADLYDHWAGGLLEITADDLPAAAR